MLYLKKDTRSGGDPLLRNLVFWVSHWPQYPAYFEKFFTYNFKNMPRVNPKFFSRVLKFNSMLKQKLDPIPEYTNFEPKKWDFFSHPPNDSHICGHQGPPNIGKKSTLFLTTLKLCENFFVSGSVPGAISRKRFS